MSNLSRAPFRFRIATRLLSESIFRRDSLCSAAGRSDSSRGVPIGRGSLPNPSWSRKLWMTASRSCRADRCSFVGIICSTDGGRGEARAEMLPPPSDVPLRRRGVFDELSDTSILAI